MDKFLIAANWKMNGDLELVHEISESLNRNKNLSNDSLKVLICPPSPYFQLFNSLLENENISLGGQNIYHEEKGAFTGEISASMLLDLACEYVIIGHSERRSLFGETDDSVNKKSAFAISQGLIPVICIGESLDERKSGKTLEIIKNQLDKDLSGIKLSDNDEFVIAYEPIWAIGTGLTPTTEEIDEVHNFIRNELNEKYPSKKDEIFILYGGSLNNKNADDILKIKNVNGGLIGGASLDAFKFNSIIKSATNLV